MCGNKLTVRLTKADPGLPVADRDAVLLRGPENLPIDAKGVNMPPGAGPYYVASKTANQQIVLQQEPVLRRGAAAALGRDARRRQMAEQTSYLQVRKGEADHDLDGLPPAAHSELTRKYGINKGRYFVNPANDPLHRAEHVAAVLQGPRDAPGGRLRHRPGGADAGRRGSTPAPRTTSCCHRASPATGRDDLPGHGRTREGEGADGRQDGKAVLYTATTRSRRPAQIIQANLAAVGIDVQSSRSRSPSDREGGQAGEPFDMNLIGWFADYPDPYDFINVLLYGKKITEKNNVNPAYFNDPAYNRKMECSPARRRCPLSHLRPARHRHLPQPGAVRRLLTTRTSGSSSPRRIGCPVYSSRGAASTW